MSELYINTMSDKKKKDSNNDPKFDYEEYINQRKLLLYQKRIYEYKGIKLALTDKQANILKLVAKGFSNIKIAEVLDKKESTIKLSVYRIMKYLEVMLDENVDRFRLVIIAQELEL